MTPASDQSGIKQLLLAEAQSIQDGNIPELEIGALIDLASDETTEPEVIEVLEDLNWNADDETLEVALAKRASVGVRDHYAYSDCASVVSAYVSNPFVPDEEKRNITAAIQQRKSG